MNGQFLDHVVNLRTPVSVEVMRSSKMTVARMQDAEGRILAQGVAKRRKTDQPCRAVGDSLAVARALADLSKHYFELAVLADQINSGALEDR